jgi:hypothetical protein
MVNWGKAIVGPFSFGLFVAQAGIGFLPTKAAWLFISVDFLQMGGF